MDKKTTIKEFLEFRSKFTKREWHELSRPIKTGRLGFSSYLRQIRKIYLETTCIKIGWIR